MELESLSTDFTSWELGPYHGALPGPMKLRAQLDGEVIVSAEVEAGFAHRGLEKAMERQRWHALVSYADHLDPEAPVFGELAVCLAAEEAGKIQVPERAQVVRTMLAELCRISSHLLYLVRFARAVGADTMIHYVLRDRERILDLFELLTGMRFSLNFVRFGGIAADVTEGFIERVLETCEMLRVRLKEYNDLFTYNRPLLDRTVGIGLLNAETVRRLGITGPNARAAGVGLDLRKDSPSLSYERMDFSVAVIRREREGGGERGEAGDCHDRLLMRLKEISQSEELLKQLCDRVMPGEFANIHVDREFVLPAGEAYVRVESSRGLLGCHLVSEGLVSPSRVQFRVPSVALLKAIPEIVPGCRIEDLPVVLASLDLSLSEVDR